MADREDLTHYFHSEYRKSGIAICISLAALAASESWYLYSYFFPKLEHLFLCKNFLWGLTILTGFAVIFNSFYVQYLHYFGMKNETRSMYEYWQKQERRGLELHENATRYFDKADTGVRILAFIAILNVIFALTFLLCINLSPSIES